MNKKILLVLAFLIIVIIAYITLFRSNTTHSGLNSDSESLTDKTSMNDETMDEHISMIDDSSSIMAMGSIMSPNVLYVTPGQKITLMNHEAQDLKLIFENGNDETQIVVAGENGMFTAPLEVGTYTYYSSLDESITGKLVVEAQDEQTEIVYTDSGFSPNSIRAQQGTTITFINESDSDMKVAEGTHDNHGLFEQENVSKNGEQYGYTFNKAGTYSVHNHYNSIHTVTVIVE